MMKLQEVILKASVSVLLGNGNGTFQAAVNNAAGSGPWSATVEDFNADGKVDVAVSNLNGANVSILLGNGNGTFQAPMNFAVGSNPYSVAVADFNGDGRADLAVTNFSGNNVSVLLGGCAVSFTPSNVFADAAGSSSSVGVNVAAGCSWTAASNAAWLTITGGSGNGNGAVSYLLAANTTGVERTGVITVSGQTFTVTQRITTQVFGDVQPADFDFDAADSLYQHGVTGGCSASPPLYCPNANVTRAQMAIFMVRAIEGGDTFSYSTTPYFTDVAPTDFGFKWIQKMKELGITAGCGATTYCPADSVTRGQMAVFIIRARLGATTVFSYPPTPYFTDVPSSHPFFSWIQKMRQVGVTAGCGATTYCPNDLVNRAQMALFIMRGGFNQFLPAGTPILLSSVPPSGMQGHTVMVTLTGQNTNFVQGTTQVAVAGTLVTAGTATVNNATSLSVQLTIDAAAPLGPRSVTAITGAEEATLPNGFTIQ